MICVGCPNDYSVLDTVLEPGNYEVSFLSSIETAYSEIANARPGRVILCMRPDDEQSLRVLSMLSLDPRTRNIPVVTCVANASGGFEQGVEDDGLSGRAPRGHGVVMH